MQSSVSINLIKQRVNFLDQILRWSLSVGRLLVIITEIVAFSTFIYRFSLDRTLIDLHEKINDEQAIVASLKNQESLYRNLQERIALASTVTTQGSRNIEILNDIEALTPSEITFNSFSIENNQISIDSSVTSISALSGFVDALKDYAQTSSVSIDSIDNKTSTTSVNVLITIKLKEDSSKKTL